MPRLPSIPRPDGRLLLATLCLLSACSSGKKGGDDLGGPTGAIALNLSPGSATVAQGGSTVVTGTLTRSGGFTGEVAILVANAPSTVNAAAFLETLGSTTTATIAVQVGATTPAQTYDITILAQASGVATATAHFMLTVTPQQGYVILGVTPSGDVSLAQGTTDNTKTLTISRFNYTAALALTAENLPAGLTVSFSPSLATGNSAALSITANASVTPGSYTILLRGTGPSSLQAPGEGNPANFTAAYTMVVNVTSGGSFTLGITPTGGVSLAQGTTNNSKTVTITRNNYAASVTLAAENLPAGLTASFAGNPVSGNSSVLTLTAGASVAPGTYNLTIRGTGPAALRAPDDTVNLEATTTLSVIVTATATGSFALGITPTGGVTLQQGAADNSKTVTITRSNYTPAVTLTAENLPSGLTAAFAGNPVSGNSSMLTLTAGAGVTPNTYTITIRGTGPAALRAPGDTASLDATATLSVTITATPTGSFALGITPTGGVTLQQGSSNNSKTVTITRTNYTANVSLSAENLPTGLTAAFAGNPVSGNSSVLTLTAGASTAPGTYTITIRGTGPAALRAPGSAPGLDATVTLTVTVSAPAPGGPFNVTVSFVGCTTEKPTHFFVQDGSGAWTRVVGTGDVYSFTLTQPKAGILYGHSIWPAGLELSYWASSELAAVNPFRFCQAPVSTPPTRSLTGTLSGKAPDEWVYLSFGNSSTSAGNGSFSISNTLEGTHDFVAHLSAITPGAVNYLWGPNDRVILIRDRVGDGSSVGTINLSTGATVVPGTLTVADLAAGENIYPKMYYRTGASCDQAQFISPYEVQTGAPVSMYGVPANLQRASDFHELEIVSRATNGWARSRWESFHTMANRSVTLGQLSLATVTKVPATYLRMRAAFNLPAGYNAGVLFDYTDMPDGPFGDPGTGFTKISASFAYLGGPGDYVLEIPDMTGVAGWSDALSPGKNNKQTWGVRLYGDTHGGNRCAEGAQKFQAVLRGATN